VVLKKKFVEKTTYELARERVADMFTRFDVVSVLFSGGKDSTAVLNLVLEEANRIGYGPVDVVFYDEEGIWDDTVQYVRRISQRKDVSLRWYCMPFKNRNACSTKQPYWYPWAPESKHLWCRPMPPEGITEIANFPTDPNNRAPAYQSNNLFFPDKTLSYGVAIGLRAQESLRRLRVVSMRTEDNWLAPDSNAPHVTMCKPIYDWLVGDVWTAPTKFGWDYNVIYDKYTRAGITPTKQRISPPFAEEPLRALKYFGLLEPAIWEKMLRRVPGAATAARYSESPLYGLHNVTAASHAGTGPDYWQAQIREAIERHPADIRAKLAARIESAIRTHFKKNIGIPIPDYGKGELISWERLYQIAYRGDLRRRKETMSDSAWSDRKVIGSKGVKK